jgi:hypothetical protein
MAQAPKHVRVSEVLKAYNGITLIIPYGFSKRNFLLLEIE